MNHDAMMDAMFWVGALFVFTPVLLAGIVFGAIYYGRRKARSQSGDGGPLA